ncbi:hypothetical protein [Metabacillus sp. FJAT-53654]|uniref:Holin n=1 Tax=Metabacillus rhizosphaerae TaxID=3117747 RepID=A0ABZ2MZ91_9BACI
MEALFTIEFTAYVGIAVILYAIRQATGLSNKYIPSIAILLGVAFTSFESGSFSSEVLLQGLKYALYGIGSVAAIKYAIEKGEEK